MSSSAKPSSDIAVAKHRVSAIAIAFTCYSLVSGGPVGIEDSVGAGGPFATVIGLCAIALLWALPQSLLTAELSAAFPTNGGSIDWVTTGLGSIAGVCNAYSLMFNQVFDLPMYPSLLVASLLQVVDLSNAVQIIIKLVVVVICIVLNIVGMEAIASSTTILTLFILCPFFVLPIVAAAYHNAFDWSVWAPSVAPSDFTSSWSVFVSGLMWNMQGWTGVGNIAAEVENPQRVYPMGVSMAIVLVTLSYIYSVLFGTALQPALGAWEDGYLVNVASNVATWFGIITAIAASVSSLSTFLSSAMAYARSLQAAAHNNYIPVPLLARNMTKYKTPVPSILLLGATTCGLMFLDLSDLVVLDTTFANISILMTSVAFLRLRYTYAHVKRPFSVPGGMAWAYASVTSIIVLGLFAFYAVGTSSAYGIAVPLGCNVAFAVIAAVAQKYGYLQPLQDLGNYELVKDGDNSSETALLPDNNNVELAATT